MYQNLCCLYNAKTVTFFFFTEQITFLSNLLWPPYLSVSFYGDGTVLIS